jgi:hypothetical protein
MFSFEDERVRFCSQCNLNVYNLSDMSRQEAETLITKTEGRLCVRFYRKADGSVLTQNCPVGLERIRRRVAWVAQVVLGMALSFVSGLGLYIFHLERKQDSLLNRLNNYFVQDTEMGTMIAPPTPEEPPPAPSEMGQVTTKPRKNSRAPQREMKR